jgi:hypothetical protein
MTDGVCNQLDVENKEKYGYEMLPGLFLPCLKKIMDGNPNQMTSSVSVLDSHMLRNVFYPLCYILSALNARNPGSDALRQQNTILSQTSGSPMEE